VNIIYALIAIAAFWLIGLHHYIKHPELKGLERFIQYKDLKNALWYIIKSHEGLQFICLIIAICYLIN